MAKCADCGFLAVRNLSTRNLDEVEMEFRRSGIPHIIPPHTSLYSSFIKGVQRGAAP